MGAKTSMAFSMPGGEAPKPAAARPIDMAHLSRQTLGDRAVEQEVLALFVQQAISVAGRMAAADVRERLFMAHGLKGSARGVGAFAIAECVAEIERDPEDVLIWERLESLVEVVRDFVIAIGR